MTPVSLRVLLQIRRRSDEGSEGKKGRTNKKGEIYDLKSFETFFVFTRTMDRAGVDVDAFGDS